MATTINDILYKYRSESLSKQGKYAQSGNIVSVINCFTKGTQVFGYLLHGYTKGNDCRLCIVNAQPNPYVYSPKSPLKSVNVSYGVA